MTAGCPALAVVLFACATPLLLSAGNGVARADGDVQQQQHSWCLKKECTCVAEPSDSYDNDQQQQVSVKCTYSGDQNVIWEQDISNKSQNNLKLIKSLVTLELKGDEQSKLTVYGKTFEAYSRLHSFNVTGFAEVTIRKHGLLFKNTMNSICSVTINQVKTLYLNTNAVQPIDGKVDVLVEDCNTVWLDSKVVSKLRSFIFRRIGNLQLSENTFKEATAEGLAIDMVLLENLTAEKLPSNAFRTSIDHLSITNCTFGTIKQKAFPVINMINVTLANVAVNQVEGEAFQESSQITNLRIIECKIQEIMERAIMSVVHNIHIERSKFGTVHTSAVYVANELTLKNNTFDRVDGGGFKLHNFHSLLVDGNTFGRTDANAFYEPPIIPGGPRRSVLRLRDNVFHRRAEAPWTPAVRLQGPANEADVTGNRFVGWCGCGPWWLVAVSADGDGGNGGGGGGGNDDGDGAWFADRNYCRPNAVDVTCANLTATDADRDFRIGEFAAVAGCKRDAAAYGRCVVNRMATAAVAANDLPVVTTMVLLILCGFAIVCAVSAVTWLNARGYFIKLRSLLTSCSRSDRNGGCGGGGGVGGGRTMTRTVSTHSLSPMSVHVYAELQRHKLSGSGSATSSYGDGSADLGVRVIVYQDKGTQTVPEELTHEMLQSLRDKLDDPDDYAEARGMIEHLYDLIRVEETCCGGGPATNWYTTGGGLDDMTSTITTKAVTVGPGSRVRDVVSVGTSTPSLDSLLPARINVPGRFGPSKQTPQRQSVYSDRRGRPSVDDEYMDPADLLYGDGGGSGMADDDTDIYCELADLRIGPPAGDCRGRPPEPPYKPTQV